MPNVFLSYAREDLKIAQKIFNDLTRNGVDVWFDDDALLPGQNWANEIRKAIRQCNYFIVLLSSNAVSKRGFVQKELKMAVDVLDLVPQDEVFIIPVRVDDCHPTHERLEHLHWVDMFPDYDKGMQKLLRAFAALANDTTSSGADVDSPSLVPNQTAEPLPRNSSVQTQPPTKMEWVTALLNCQSMHDLETRNAIVDQLSFKIKSTIKRNPNAKVDVLNIVSRCMEFDNGLAELVESLRFFEDGAKGMQRIDAFIGKTG